MSKYRDLLVSSENLSWAWRKARRLISSADSPYDAAELAAFELDLENQLRSIAAEFDRGRYKLSPLVLLPQPKKPDRQRMRQSFYVTVRDQVAWIAVANVIGPTLDSKMPPWSYGHRLYKAAWYEEVDGRARLELGPYRHTSGSLYRKFKHSWPLFRRHVSLTARVMTHGLSNPASLDMADRSAFQFSERPPYLDIAHWPPRSDNTLYYASIDLEKFYPSVAIEAIQRSLRKYLDGYREDSWLQELLTGMLTFRVTKERSSLLNNSICEPLTKSGVFNGIPTNLMVAGFLSNVAMLPLDRIMERKLRRNRKIAHFRFVDDHAFLAYDFVELCHWIKTYSAALRRLRIGPHVSATKYDPPELAEVVEEAAQEEAEGAAKLKSHVDGSNPSKLMTKTLALVSELAGADFDILAEQSRELKLRELEWLLLADISEREIRTDTRAAFAAGRIAKLVPLIFTPSLHVLQTSRELANLEADDKVDRNVLSVMRAEVARLQRQEARRYRNRLDHYFKLMFQAFHDHVEKPRLMVRVLDYCRSTGQAGTAVVLNAILELPSESDPLCKFLKALAIQTIARHIVTATFEASDTGLLFRQRQAAARYLDSISRLRVRDRLRRCLDFDATDVAAVSARNMMLAAVAASACITRKKSIRRRMRAFSDEIGAPDLLASSSVWESRTGSPIGVWAHWLDELKSEKSEAPGRVWRLTATRHDPSNRLDWCSLRKGPSLLPRSASMYLSENERSLLLKSDSGWLLDQRSSTLPLGLGVGRRRSRAASCLYRHLAELERRPDEVTLLQWVSYLRSRPHYDPRSGEWSALEIIRQLAKAVQRFDGGTLADLDQLHPSNVLVPRVWTVPQPPTDESVQKWTWESWKQFARRGAVKVVKNKIDDYRRSPLEGGGPEDVERLWRSRLRGVGLLLFGLCRHDFSLPAFWNVRGMERNVAGLVRSHLEEATVSSCTQTIIEAAVLPRSVETALMVRNFWAFFGIRSEVTINDTATDPPNIVDIQELVSQVQRAQSILEQNQISVMNYASRQLVPMNAVQLTRAATVPIQVEDAE